MGADVFSSASRVVTTYALRIRARETTVLSGNELTALNMVVMAHNKLTHSAIYRVRHETLAVVYCV